MRATNKIKSFLTLKLHHCCFYNGKVANVYVDCFGDTYIKQWRWAMLWVFKGNVNINRAGF